MKRPLVLFSFVIIPFLTNCNNSSIDMPKSPFDDHYSRIGMQGKYGKTGDMTQADYNAIKTYINTTDSDEDIDVKSYHRQEEIRDLKYAYFGGESSAISQCSMTSHSEDLTRYKNRVFINLNVTDQQIQTANGGIQKSKSSLTDYTFDDHYKEKNPTKYGSYSERIKTKNNDEEEKVTQPVNQTGYDDTQIYRIFGLKPYNSRIKSHFIEDGEYKFKLLANNNNAVYYMTKDENDQTRYLIKEGYSIFSEFHTTMGRSYKAQDNYFYEGLLEKDVKEETFHFTHFRFYHELLILSKSIDGEGVPVLYLDKPVLIEFSETTYSNIEYAEEEKLDTYNDPIPDPSEN